MFFFKKNQPAETPSSTLRDLLFADESLSDYVLRAPTESGAEPLRSFYEAFELHHMGDNRRACELLQSIAESPEYETRFRIQAWRILKSLGVAAPPERQKELLGVVFEVEVGKGVDLLAAYEDRSARYFNFSGAAIIWEHPDDSLDARMDEIFILARGALERLGPWNKPRPPAPGRHEVRMNFLTVGGLYFGQGPMNAMSQDPLGAPILNAAARLMHAMIQKSKVGNN